MRLSKFHCSFGIGFAEAVAANYGLINAQNPDPYEPLLLVGAYNDRHFSILHQHRNICIVYWCGSDSQFLLKRKQEYQARGQVEFWHLLLRDRKNIFHISPSHWITEDLTALGLPNIIELPALLKDHSDITPVPLGDAIFMYQPNNKNYHGGIYEEVKKNLPYEFIEAIPKTFNRVELLEAYKRSFIALRFTEHDGLSETVCELGLMGRRVIHNGDTPNCIKYDRHNIPDIIAKINAEYKLRHLYNPGDMAEQMKRFLHIPYDWLDLDNYKFEGLI